MYTEPTPQNNKSDRENNLSSTEPTTLPETKTKEPIESPQSPRVSKNSHPAKSNDAYYHEDEDFEYYRVPKKGSNKKGSKKGVKEKTDPEPDQNIDPAELMKKISLDEVPDIRDVSFKGSSLVGGSALNLRF